MPGTLQPRVQQIDLLSLSFKAITEVDRAHVIEMLRPTVYPDNYPKPAKFKAMEKAAKGLGVVDVEDIGKVFKKVPL